MEEAFLLRSPLSIFLALILVLSSPPAPSLAQEEEIPCPNKSPDDFYVLDYFYSIHQKALKRNGVCICSWEGVACNPESGSVTALNLSNYGLDGSIPPYLSLLADLTAIDLSHNHFSGSIPWEFGSLKQLTCLNLSWNLLAEIPPRFWTFFGESQQQYPSRRDQFWRGRESPHGRAVFPSLASKLGTLDLSNNRLNGPVPRNLGALTSLQRLNLSANQLGVLSQEADQWNFINSLAKCPRLQELDLSGNGFLGPLPDSVGKLSAALKILDVSSNNFTGRIPNQLFSLSSLTLLLNFSHNQFNGSLPEEIGYLTNLVVLDVSHNHLSGEIPPSLGNCQKLELVYLQNNNFSGNISSGSFNARQPIIKLNLSRNNLSGTIPSFLACISQLQLLDVSFNDFEGAVPAGGIFDRLNYSSFDGNNRLQADEKQPSSPCGPIAYSPTSDISPTRNSKSRLPKAAVPAIIVITILILLILVLCLFYKYNCFANESSGGFSKEISFPKASLRVTYGSLQMATKGFSHSCLLGVGGTGCVYRGFLAHKNKEVAVKVLDRDVLGDLKSFKEECKFMKSIEHKNLVKLLSSCAAADINGHQFKALVYELMPSGNLEMWLHEEMVVSQLNPSKKWSLNLYQRLNIAIDVASALVHLHWQLKKPIVHCNLKPSNILLAEDMTAQVTDFGMNRFFRLDKIVMRSTGYIAPELAAGNPISPSWDVYSFGIILLEMFTGKRPTDEDLNSTENPDLHGYVFQRYPLDIEDIIDPLLLSEETGAELTERTRSCVTSIIHTALICSKELPEARMDMREALTKLENAKLALLDAGSNGMNVYESSDHGGSSDDMLG